MDDLQLKGRWHQVRGRLKENYADLSDDDLMYEEGKEDELWGRIQTKTGKTIDDIKREVKSWFD
ncbi:MAG: CsbD family protein [Chitinophagales bacterium]|jgi:uncharacterized protein YjbJ (UPF0337 family)|nr:CsbD family protein [Chitinophagales bacterium]